MNAVHVIMKPCLRHCELISTFDPVVVFLFRCVRQEVEGIVMVLSLWIASFTSLSLHVSTECPFFPPLEDVTKAVQLSS